MEVFCIACLQLRRDDDPCYRAHCPMPYGLKIVSQKEAAKADFVICIRASFPTAFPDNAKGTCVDCGSAVVFRPYLPREIPKLCIECFSARENLQ